MNTLAGDAFQKLLGKNSIEHIQRGAVLGMICPPDLWKDRHGPYRQRDRALIGQKQSDVTGRSRLLNLLVAAAFPEL